MLRTLWFALPLLLVPAALAQESSDTRRLVIAGGGSLPNSVFETFRKLAGEKLSLVVIPTASSSDPNSEELRRVWSERGFTSVNVLHTRDREVANNEKFVEPLDQATAVWFGGGSQSKIAEAYRGTLVERKLHALLSRGGVIGGTSAGAAIQSDVMIASGRSEPTLKMGLGFLPECVIDQHFLARDRIRRSVAAIRLHPERVGIGIDEGTALIVINDEATVVGRSFVLRIEHRDDGMEIRSFGDGERVPLAKLKIEGSKE